MQRLIDPRRLATHHYKAWHASLDEALELLPEMPNCPHELGRLVARNPSSTQKRFCLVTDERVPVGVVAVRRIQRHWGQLGLGIMPGTTIPALDGYEVPAIAASGLDVWVDWIDQPPTSNLVRTLFSIPVFRMNRGGDFEQYWHESGLWGMVKSARRATKKYRLEIDGAGAADWTIRNWARKWRTTETETCDDLLVAADYYQARGQYHTFRLLLGDIPVAGNTFFVDGDRLVYQTTFFDETYRRDWVGTRLLDLVFQWAAGTDYRQIDLGGGHDYKAMWAPEDGRLWSYNVCPQHIYLRRCAVQLARGVRSRLSGRRGGGGAS